MLFDDDDEFLDEDEFESSRAGTITTLQEKLRPPRESTLCLGHEAVEKSLLAQVAQDRVPHAMIFAGGEGIGKATFAFRVARFMLSRSLDNADTGGGLFGEALPPAPPPENMDLPDDHPDLRKVASGAHPDLLTVERQFDEKRGRYKGALDVEQVRRIPPFMGRTAAQGGWRVVIVDDADTMTRSAQNAILKVLEEPPTNALLILIAHRPGLLIPTIRSRSRMVNFNAPDADIFARLLRMEHRDLTTREIDTLYAIASGSVGQAARLVAEGGLEAVDRVMALFSDWPDWNWPQIHVLADLMSKPGQDDSFQAFQDVMQWVVRGLLQARARGVLPTGTLGQDTLVRMLNHYSLAQWLAIADALQVHFDTASHSNLDRRHAVLGAFSVFGGQ